MNLSFPKLYTAWKVSKYGVIYGPYFPVFGLNTGKCGPEITPYLDTFHAVLEVINWICSNKYGHSTGSPNKVFFFGKNILQWKDQER